MSVLEIKSMVPTLKKIKLAEILLDFATFALQDCQDLSSNLPILELAHICPVTLSRAVSQRHVYVSNTQEYKGGGGGREYREE